MAHIQGASDDPFGFAEVLTRGLDSFTGHLPHSLLPLSPLPRPGSHSEAVSYLAELASASAAAARAVAASHWDPEALFLFEDMLRLLVIALTPNAAERRAREAVMQRVGALVQSGIRYCKGLSIEPYGSFVSGLYSPAGDLDLSIEGTAIMYGGDGLAVHTPASEMERETKQWLLKALASRLAARGAQDLLRVTHARVPIIKFRDPSFGVECDVAVGSCGAQFKSVAMGMLAGSDWRVGALVRLVKQWARHQSINDSSQGTFNSFALTLLVVFHLQHRSPAVLPPLRELLLPSEQLLSSSRPETPADRPMHDGCPPDPQELRVMAQRLQLWRTANAETLAELLASFFGMYRGIFAGWCGNEESLCRVLRRVRVSTWHGKLYYSPWDRDGAYCSVEDPFDSTDNCARTLRDAKCAAGVAAAFSGAATLCTAVVCSPAAAGQPGARAVFDGRAIKALFGSEALQTANAVSATVQEWDSIDPVFSPPMWVPSSLRWAMEGVQTASKVVVPHSPRPAGAKPAPAAELMAPAALSLVRKTLNAQRPFARLVAAATHGIEIVEVPGGRRRRQRQRSGFANKTGGRRGGGMAKGESSGEEGSKDDDVGGALPPVAAYAAAMDASFAELIEAAAADELFPPSAAGGEGGEAVEEAEADEELAVGEWLQGEVAEAAVKLAQDAAEEARQRAELVARQNAKRQEKARRRDEERDKKKAAKVAGQVTAEQHVGLAVAAGTQTATDTAAAAAAATAAMAGLSVAGDSSSSSTPTAAVASGDSSSRSGGTAVAVPPSIQEENGEEAAAAVAAKPAKNPRNQNRKERGAEARGEASGGGSSSRSRRSDSRSRGPPQPGLSPVPQHAQRPQQQKQQSSEARRVEFRRAANPAAAAAGGGAEGGLLPAGAISHPGSRAAAQQEGESEPASQGRNRGGKKRSSRSGRGRGRGGRGGGEQDRHLPPAAAPPALSL